LSEALVHVIGLSSPAEVSKEKADLLAQAQVLAAPARLLKFFPKFAGQKLPLTGALNDWLLAIEAASREKGAVVLASGDPNFFGVAQKLLTVVDPARVRLWPGVTMVQRAFALLKKTWANVETVSLHGRASFREFWAAAYRAGRDERPLAVYTDPQNGPAALAAALLARGQDYFKMATFEDLATDKEKMTFFSLKDAAKSHFSPLNLVVLEADPPPQKAILGAPEELYDPENGLVTKREIRLAALGLLELTGGETFWDLGAGCGSVAVEAGRLLDRGELWALEKNPSRAQRILANRRRFGLAHLEVVQGQAPEGLAQLPDPDRVFVGGGGDDLPAILEATLARLKPGGIVVAAVIDPRRLAQAAAILSPKGPPEATQILAARAKGLGSGYFFKPLNPVFLVRGRLA
jgi:precorrin-6Y C5,15-methyltransferase (decarboxylating)